MSERRTSTRTSHNQILTWNLVALLVLAVAAVIWFFAIDLIVVLIHAFEAIAWILSLILWPFRF